MNYRDKQVTVGKSDGVKNNNNNKQKKTWENVLINTKRRFT